MIKRNTNKSIDLPVDALIEKLKDAIETVNMCSDELAKDDIFVYIRPLARASTQGDKLELYNIILHRSLFNSENNTKGKATR